MQTGSRGPLSTWKIRLRRISEDRTEKDFYKFAHTFQVSLLADKLSEHCLANVNKRPKCASVKKQNHLPRASSPVLKEKMQDFVKEERFLNRIGWKGLPFTKSFCITLCSFTPLESHALAFSKMSYNKSNPPLVQKDVLEGNCSVELGCPNIRCCDSWRFSRPLSCWSALFVFNLACCYPESAYFIWRECQEKEPNLIDSEDLICFAPSGLYFISGFTRDSNLLQKVFFIKKWSVSGTNSFFPFLTQSFMIISLVNYKKTFLLWDMLQCGKMILNYSNRLIMKSLL